MTAKDLHTRRRALAKEVEQLEFEIRSLQSRNRERNQALEQRQLTFRERSRIQRERTQATASITVKEKRLGPARDELERVLKQLRQK